MTNNEFARLLEQRKEKIRKIIGPFRGNKQWYELVKIAEEMEMFNFYNLADGTVEIYYMNSIQSIHGLYKEGEQAIVFPLIIFYTNISYYIMSAKEYATKNVYEILCKEKQKMEQEIREMCMQQFEKCVITPIKCKRMNNFVKRAISQLYHCIDFNGGYSTKVIEKDAEELKEIRKVYETFKVGRKYIYFYDSILKENVKILIDSPDSAYAISILFCDVYITSVLWLKEYDPTEQWCPIVPWKLIIDFRALLSNLYY